MKTILIATDYSRSANNALEYAAALAKGMGARLVIFNVLSLATPPSAAPVSIPDIDELIRENNERMARISAKTAEAYGIQTEGVTSTDLILDGLNREVKKQQADLVVLGMKKKSLLSKILGTITTSIIRRAKYPVLIIPHDASFKGIRKILFACNYKYLCENSRLESIYQLASAYQAQVQILHVEKEVDFLPIDRKYKVKSAPNMEELLTGIKHTYKFLHEDDIIEGIERGIDEYHADILVMVPHKAGLWKSFFHRSLTREMALQSHVPLLALPEEEKEPEKAKMTTAVKAS